LTIALFVINGRPLTESVRASFPDEYPILTKFILMIKSFLPLKLIPMIKKQVNDEIN
jgi:hypothetical protein